MPTGKSSTTRARARRAHAVELGGVEVREAVHGAAQEDGEEIHKGETLHVQDATHNPKRARWFFAALALMGHSSSKSATTHPNNSRRRLLTQIPQRKASPPPHRDKTKHFAGDCHGEDSSSPIPGNIRTPNPEQVQWAYIILFGFPSTQWSSGKRP